MSTVAVVPDSSASFVETLGTTRPFTDLNGLMRTAYCFHGLLGVAVFHFVLRPLGRTSDSRILRVLLSVLRNSCGNVMRRCAHVAASKGAPNRNR